MSQILQFNILLSDSAPSIWRTFQVMDDYRLDHFHQVLQIIMGWENRHLHKFSINDKYYEMSMPQLMDLYEEGEDETKYFLRDFSFQQNDIIGYLYDFGDSWEHILEVETVMEGKIEIPLCLAGKYAGPQEDSGGIHHYQHLVKILQNPKHPQYADFAGWLPENHDPTFFDLKGVNIELKRFGLFRKENPQMTSSPWQMTGK